VGRFYQLVKRRKQTVGKLVSRVWHRKNVKELTIIQGKVPSKSRQVVAIWNPRGKQERGGGEGRISCLRICFALSRKSGHL
jgi:hypothetical protein